MVAVEYFGYTDKKGKSRIGRHDIELQEHKFIKFTPAEKRKKFYVVEKKFKTAYGGKTTQTSFGLTYKEAKKRVKLLKEEYPVSGMIYPFRKPNIKIRKADHWEKEAAILAKRKLKGVV